MNKTSDFLIRGKWNCIKCGACCSYIKPLADAGKFDPAWVRPDGSCIKLKDKLCTIYWTRPEICHIEVSLKGTTDKQKAKMCKTMKDWAGRVR